MRAILTYHSLDTSGSVISIDPQVFRQHVEWLASGRVRVVDIPTLMSLDDNVDAVALTFDDGFVSFGTEAVPLLQARGLTATVFVVTTHVGADNRWRQRADAGIPVLPLLDWDAIGRAREAGMSVGAHTRTHPRLPEIGAGELEEELSGAADDFERRLGVRPAEFAYPYGAVDARVAAAVARCYSWACTTDFATLDTRAEAARLPRLDAWYFRDPRQLLMWGTTQFRGWVWTRRQARRVRAALRPAAGSQ